VESPSDIAHVSSIIRQCFLGDSLDTEFAVRDNKVLIPRVMPESEITEFLTTGDVEQAQSPEDSFKAVKLDFRTQGLLDSLRFIPDSLIEGDLDPDQIQVNLKATGINFRHVLYALGKFSAAEYAARPAGECSGVVSAIGENVKQFQVGDRIVASGIFNAFTTVVRIPASIAKRIPDSMDFITAAQFPLTYITSWFSLVNMGHIKKGDNVLIHSGSGAVGQSAITTCQYFEANVFVTCGNDEKKAFLMEEYGIPENHIYSSKDFRFVDGILKATKGRGVDIILNSLSGEFITESCRCLATFGRFIEIGKNDILMRSKIDMGIFNNSTSFIAVDLSRVYELEKETVGEMVQDMMDLISDGSLKKATPVHVRPFSEAADAFRYMSTGKHIGKMVLDMSDVASLKVSVPCLSNASSLTTLLLFR
jgi:NADPH:quinone reductase-like Zn-dependent oxidoreductase